MKLIIYLFSLISMHVIAVQLYAQNYQPDYRWGKSFKGDRNLITSSALDQNGALYNVGHIDDGFYIDLDPSTNSFIIEEAQFIQKLDSQGNFVWGGGFSAYRQAIPIHVRDARVVATTDDQDNVLVAGISNISFDADIRTGQADAFMINQNNGVFYVLKYNENGEIQWGVNFLNPSALGRALNESFEINTLKTDQQGNVYVGGYFNADSADFDPGTDSFFLSSEGGSNAFALKLDPTGNFKWAISFGGNTGIDPQDDYIFCNCDQVQDLVIDDTGNVLITGQVAGTVDMDPGTGPSETYIIQANGNYILKLDSTGDFKWGKLLQKVNSDVVSNSYFTVFNIFRNTQNELFLTGEFSDTVDFDPDTAVAELRHHHPAPTYKESDMFFLKLGTRGTFEWVKTWGPLSYSNGFPRVRSYMSHQGQDGWFYFTGSTFPRARPAPYVLLDMVDYNPEPGKALLNRGLKDQTPYYVSAFDELGAFQWVKGIDQLDQGAMSLASIVVDKYHNIVISGQGDTLSPIDVDPFKYDTADLTFNGKTSFTFKWGQTFCTEATTSFGTSFVSACELYLTPSGNILTKSGTYLDTLSNSIGCDSILTIHLTITKPVSSNKIEKKFTCELYVLPNGDTIRQSGLYSYTLPRDNQCDSIVIMDVTIVGKYYPMRLSAVDSFISPSEHHIWKSSGQYQDTLINQLGCDSILLIDLTIEKFEECSPSSFTADFFTNSSEIQIYPNPADYSITIHTTFDQEVTVQLKTITGAVITTNKHNRVSEINISQLPKGTYFVTLQTQQKIWHQSIIKR